MEKGICRYCFNELDISNFRRSIKKGREYFEWKCHSCTREHAKAAYEANIENEKLRNKDRYWSDPEKHRERGREWYYANRERAIASSIEWRKNNRDKDREASRKWRSSHPTESRLLAKKRRAKIAAATIEIITSADIQKIRKAQKGKCAICRKITPKGHIDHIKPLARGGEHSKRNLQILCEECNLSKSSKDPIDFMQSLGRLI